MGLIVAQAGFSCHTKMVWLLVEALHARILTGASFASTSEI